MQAFLETMLNQCLNILESDNGSILLTDKNCKEFVVRVARGRHAVPILGKRLQLGEGIAGLAAMRGKPILVEDISKSPELKDLCRTQNYRTNSFLSVPMISSGKLLGVINVTEKADACPFTIKELSFVSAVASSAAVSIERMIYADSLEKQLEAYKKSTAATHISSAIAHELNNPLDGIMRYAQLCLPHVPEGSVMKEYLLEMQSGLKRMAGIIRSMLEFSFAGGKSICPAKRDEVDINELLEKTILFFRQQAHFKRIEIITEFSRDLPKVGDCGLQQVFTNFFKNAMDAVGENGKIVIRDYCLNGNIYVDFMDSGKGVDENLKEKIFEPFFTTKPEGKGLGLAIAKKIVDCYDGKIILENAPLLGGAKFSVVIPLGGSL